MKRIIQSDVQRLNRLISDISNATRLDAELNRGKPPRLIWLVNEIGAALAPDISEANNITLITSADRPRRSSPKSRALHRLSTVWFPMPYLSPRAAEKFISACWWGKTIRLVVADEGPGIDPEMTERIFERFTATVPRADPPQAQELPASRHSGLGEHFATDCPRAWWRFGG